MFIWQTRRRWLMPSCQHDRTTAMSSAIVAVCGSQSDTPQAALTVLLEHPLAAHERRVLLAHGQMIGLKLPGSGWPCSLLSSGLGSNRSMWLGRSSMNRKMTALARAVGFGAAAASRANSHDRATPPNPAPPFRRASRREAESVHIQELVAVEQGVAEVHPAAGPLLPQEGSGLGRLRLRRGDRP